MTETEGQRDGQMKIQMKRLTERQMGYSNNNGQLFVDDQKTINIITGEGYNYIIRIKLSVICQS